MTLPGVTLTGWGGFQRFAPDVSAAYGTPSHFFRGTSVVLVSKNPWISPDVVRTSKSLLDGSTLAAETDPENNGAHSTRDSTKKRLSVHIIRDCGLRADVHDAYMYDMIGLSSGGYRENNERNTPYTERLVTR